VVLNEIIEDHLLSIAASESMKECLQLRLKLIGSDKACKSRYDINELEILKLKTEAQIDKMSVIIFDKKKNFQEDFGIYVRELQEQENQETINN